MDLNDAVQSDVIRWNEHKLNHLGFNVDIVGDYRCFIRNLRLVTFDPFGITPERIFRAVHAVARTAWIRCWDSDMLPASNRVNSMTWESVFLFSV